MTIRYARNAVIVLGLALVSTLSFAGGKEHRSFDRHHGIRNEHRVWTRHDRDWERNRRFEWARQRREREMRRHWLATRHDRRPPGWDRGRKVGWGHNNVPPGQVHNSGYSQHHAPTWGRSQAPAQWQRSTAVPAPAPRQSLFARMPVILRSGR